MSLASMLHRATVIPSLNPYYTGSYSMSWFSFRLGFLNPNLNPYYTGSYSMSFLLLTAEALFTHVLILIILEVTL